MKLFLRRTFIYLLLLAAAIQDLHAQAPGQGDLVFTGVNSYDDDVNGSTQNDVFSFILLRNCPANTVINFTDLGWTGGSFQSTSCGAGAGSQTDGVLRWSSGASMIRAGTQIVISCKYNPAANIGTIDFPNSVATAATSALPAASREYISLGLAGDQLFAFTGSLAAPLIIGGINVNRKTWETTLATCDFTSSASLMPVESASLRFRSITPVNARYNCNTLIGSSTNLRNRIQDTTQWSKDYNFVSPSPLALDLKKTPPCNLTIVNPDAGGIVYVNNQSATPGDGSSWASPLPELRDALAAAADAVNGVTQIWVARGTYKPTAGMDPDVSFVIPSNIKVYGGFAGNEATIDTRNIASNLTILSGDLGGDDGPPNSIVLNATSLQGVNSYHVISLTNTGAQTLLDGVIVAGGRANGPDAANGPRRSGGAIYSIDGSITIKNTRFYGSGSVDAGGAIYNSGTHTMELQNCVFYGNRSAFAAAAINSGNTFKLVNVTITGNTGVTNAGGVGMNGGTFISYNSIISGNTANADADYIFYGAPAVIRDINYTILGNQYYINTATPQPTPAVVFVDAPNANLRLTPANPAINRGDPQTNVGGYPAQAGDKDLAGQLRTSNMVIDLGAYEYQAQPQTITFPPFATTITYGDENIDPGATTNGDATIIYTSDNPAVAQVIAGRIRTTGAGTAVITAHATATNSYLPAAPVTQTITVNKKGLTITVNDVTRPYNTPNPAPAFTYNGFVYGEQPDVLTGSATAVFGGQQNSDAGTYVITTDLSGLSSGNYSFTGVNGTLTIGQQTQTITLTQPTAATYGDAPLTLPLNSDAGLPIVYTVSGPATISGNTLTITGAGDVTITANQPGNTNYSPAAEVTHTFSVAKAQLTVTASNKSRPYGQANPVLDYTITGFVNGDNTGVVSGIAIISTIADINSPAGAYPLQTSTGTLSAANYVFTAADGTLTIDPATQTITFPAIGNKTYGDAPFPLTATSDAGLTVSFTVTSGPATISGNILTITGAGAIVVTATQAGDANVAAAAPVPQSFTVMKAPLIVRPDNQQRFYGANNPALTYTYDGLVNGDDNTALTGTPALSTTAGLNSVPGDYPITVTNIAGLSSANYTLSAGSGILRVVIAPQTISFPALANKVYGDAPFPVNASSSSGLTVTYSVVSGPATISGNTITVTGTGVVTIAADQAGNSNHTAATQVTQAFTVSPAVLTVTADNKTKTYLQPNPALEYTITGFVNGDNASIVTGAAGISTIADVNSTPGAYPITVIAGSLSAANYTFSFVDGSLNITAAGQTITFPALTDQTYGDAPVTLNATSSSGLPVTYIVTSGPAAINGNILTITGAGSVTVTAQQAGNVNYSAAPDVSNAFLVAPAQLTVTADDKHKEYGDANPTLTYTLSGFVNGDNSSVVSGTPVLSTTADASSLSGTYPISITGGTLSAANYTFLTASGILTVGPAAQTISFPVITGKTYGDAPFTISAASSSGLPITYSILSGPATINGTTITITGAGTITIAADQAGNASYLPAIQVTQTISVAKAPLTVRASDDSRAYNGNAYTGGNGVNYTGFVNGDDAARLGGSLTYTGSSQGAVNAGSYVITPAGLSSNDYDFTYTDGQLTITRATQTITFTAPGDKNQGDPDFTLTATASSGLPVTFSGSNNAVISVNGNTAQVGVPGSVDITATQAGDANYEPAPAVVQTVTVHAYSAPVITARGNTTFCSGADVVLESTTAPAYEWYRNGNLVTGASASTFTVTESGSYTVKAIYDNGFSITSVATDVTVNPLPVGNVQMNGSGTISKGETVQLLASGGDTYVWSPAAGLNNANIAQPTARPAVTTTYEVTITNAAGCLVTQEITINVKEDFKLEATNILTPNGDGRNDLWVVKNIDMYPENEVMIYDRAGRLIYRQRGYTNNWDGKLNGQRLAEGTYYYIVDLGDNKPKFKGFITIVH
jgi:gliding motility-associated-like protein